MMRIVRWMRIHAATAAGVLLLVAHQNASAQLDVEDADQLLARHVAEEGGRKVLTLVLDPWSNPERGELTDKSDLSFEYQTAAGSRVTQANGFPVRGLRDYSSPVALTVISDNGKNTEYEVRVEILDLPIRIPGEKDNTGVMGMKFFADPEIFVDGDKYYLYPTTDGYADWTGHLIHCFESEDLVTWKDKGVVLDLEDQNLDGRADQNSLPGRRNAWAPAMAKRDGKYYLYFSGRDQSNNDIKGEVNVAVSDRPDRGFRIWTGINPALGDIAKPGRVARSIDPAVFQDPQHPEDWYLAWGQFGGIHYARLNDDMVTYDPDTVMHQRLPNYTEGAFFNARKYKGQWTYYFTYSSGDANSENYRISYATAPGMEGPWTYRGEILNKDPDKGLLGTGHSSIIQVPGTDDWYMAYHTFLNDDMRPRLMDRRLNKQLKTGNKREVRIAKLSFSQPSDEDMADGSVPLIHPVSITYDGVHPQTVP